MASPFAYAFAAAALSLTAGSAMACPDLAACGGMSANYGYYTEQASFGPMVDGAYDQTAGPGGYDDDQGYGPDQGPGYDQGPQAGAEGPPPYDPRYDAGAGDAAYDHGGQAYGASSYGARSYQSASRSSSVSASQYGYDSGWQRVEGPAATGHGAYGGVSVESREYDSGWRVRQGPTEIVRGGRAGALCPPGSAYQYPHPRYGCPLAAGNPVPVPSSFFYDTGGVGPVYGGGGGGGGGGMVIVGGGARAGAFAFASARASASVHVGGHFGGRGHGCGCGGRGGGHH